MIPEYITEEEKRRVKYAKTKIEALGYAVTQTGAAELTFQFKGETVRLYPYTGWFTGKSVKDGRGIENLLKQIKKQ